jgi:hypothetical protein
LIHLRRRFYKYASPTDFAAFASFARKKIQPPIASIVHPKMNIGKEPFKCGMRRRVAAFDSANMFVQSKKPIAANGFEQKS